jgi:hypothetical protein
MQVSRRNRKIRSIDNDILEVCIKHFKYLSEKSATGLTQEEADFMKTMQDIDRIYKSELNRVRLEGEFAGETYRIRSISPYSRASVADIKVRLAVSVAMVSIERPVAWA